MSKAKLKKCFICYVAKRDDSINFTCDRKKEKISRKKKKILHRAIKIFSGLAYGGSWYMDIGTSCSKRSDYNFLQPIIQNLGFYEKHWKAISLIKKIAYYHTDEVLLDTDKTWRLGWFWELDDDYYSSSGVMPFQFGPDPKDRTWCWEETNKLCNAFGLDILQIKNEKDFIKQITKKINEKFVFPFMRED